MISYNFYGIHLLYKINFTNFLFAYKYTTQLIFHHDPFATERQAY